MSNELLDGRALRRKSEIFAAPLTTNEWWNTRPKHNVRSTPSLVADSSINPDEFTLMSLSRVLFAKDYSIPQVAQNLGISESDSERFRSKVLELESLSSEITHHHADKMLDVSQAVKNRRTQTNPLIMMGTTPSGPLHLGNMYSIATGLAFASEAYRLKGVKPRIVFGFNDFTISSAEFPQVPERREALSEFLDRLSEYVGVPIELQPFSELQRTDRFRKVLSNALNSRLVEVHEVVDGRYQRFSSGKLDDRKDYRVGSLAETIGIRAAVEKPDLYILGGDHHHAGHNFRVGRGLNVREPIILRMGTLYALSGDEMHASAGNSIPYSELRDDPNLFGELAKLGRSPRCTIGPAEYLRLVPPKYGRIYGQPRPQLRSV